MQTKIKLEEAFCIASTCNARVGCNSSLFRNCSGLPLYGCVPRPIASPATLKCYISRRRMGLDRAKIMASGESLRGLAEFNDRIMCRGRLMFNGGGLAFLTGGRF